MAFQKGQPKPEGSGRKKGTPNKTGAYNVETIRELLKDYQESGLMQSDFAALEPKDRIFLAEKYTTYVIPKQQAISADITVGTTNSLEQLLTQLATEQQ